MWILYYEIDLNWYKFKNLLNLFKSETSLSLEANSEAYSEPCQVSKMEVFGKILNGFSCSTIFAKSFIFDVCRDFEFTSESSNDLSKKFHLRCLTEFWNQLCINYLRKTITCLFYCIWAEYSILHGQIRVTLCSTYLLRNHVFL